MEQAQKKLAELSSNFKFPDIGNLFASKFSPLKKDDESNKLVSIGSSAPSSSKSRSTKSGGSEDRLKAVHQLWYIEDNMTLVPMVCYKSKDAPETSIVLSKKGGEQVWCVPSTGSLALSNLPPLEGKECTPLAGGMAWKINLGQRPKRRIFRKLVVTGTTMAIGAGILKGVQFASTNEAIQSQINKIKGHFQRDDVVELDSNLNPFHPGTQSM